MISWWIKIFQFISDFYNEPSDEDYPRLYAHFCLLSIKVGPLIQVFIKNQMQFVYLRTCVPLYLVCGSN